MRFFFVVAIKSAAASDVAASAPWFCAWAAVCSSGEKGGAWCASPALAGPLRFLLAMTVERQALGGPSGSHAVSYLETRRQIPRHPVSPPPGHLCGPYFKVTARPNNGNPAVLFSQCYKPHLANWKKMCLNSTFFRYSARSPHRATKPSRGWLRVGVSKPQFILVATVAARN